MSSRRMRMVAVDMDGTLLGADGKVSARNLAALKAAEHAGLRWWWRPGGGTAMRCGCFAGWG